MNHVDCINNIYCKSILFQKLLGNCWALTSNMRITSSLMSGILLIKQLVSYSLITHFSKVLMAFSLLWISTKSQDFCERFQNNNRTALIYTDSGEDLLLFIIGSDYWQITANESELSFISDDRQPIGSSDLLKSGHKFVVKAEPYERNIEFCWSPFKTT